MIVSDDKVDGPTVKDNNNRMLRGRSHSQARNSEIEYKWKEMSKVELLVNPLSDAFCSIFCRAFQTCGCQISNKIK